MLKGIQKQQQGAVLVVSMIMLIVLTLYGLSASNSSIMQVKMTTTNNNAQVALNAAESAIQRGILDVEALTEVPDEMLAFGAVGRGNIYLYSDAAPVLTDDTTWDGTFTTQALPANALTLSGQSARYFVVYHGIIEDGDISKASERTGQLGDRYDGQDAAAVNSCLFKIIGMGEGAAGSSRRIVEAFYRRDFPIDAGEEA